MGAFGAHNLRVPGALPQDQQARLLDVFETAARYQMYHALGLFAVAWMAQHGRRALANAAGWLLTLGVVLFCGSLYLLVLMQQNSLGRITPLGGVAFIVGWLLLALSAISGKKGCCSAPVTPAPCGR